jgi:transposase
MHPPGFVLTATRDPGPRLRRYALRPARRAPGSWAAQAQASAVSELRGFAKGLRKDWAAITELTTPYSSGAVEGHVNRIKMIQRQMYGRPKPDLLRKRVLLAD